MAQIVLITSGILSIRNANIQLARRLVRAGQRVTYASPDPIREAVEAQGIAFVQLDGAAADLPDEQRGARGRAQRALGWLARFATIRERRRRAVAALRMEGFADQIRELDPELLLIDVELHPYIIAARALGLRLALLSTWISLVKRPGLPPLHHSIVPGRGWSGTRLGIEIAWLRYRAWKRWNAALQQIRAVGVSPAAVLECFAAQVGFPFTAEVDADQWLLPFSYRSLPVVCLNAFEFDLPHTPAPGYVYVGPMVAPERVEPADRQVPPELEDLLARHAAGDPRPLVYSAFGAFFWGDDHAFFQRVIAAVADRPDWDVVIGLGGRVDMALLGPLPRHVHAFSWVPQLQVLEQADCAVIHTGISTINECIAFGVPMLAYPFKGTTDQMGNAARIAHHGLGIVADRDADDPQQIRRRIESILGDPSFAAAVGRMREHARRYERERRAETLVEQLLQAGVLRR